jgi:hypothetical protein
LADYRNTKITYDGELPMEKFDKDSDEYGFETDAPAVAEQWINRRPICPYGCGQEGQLKEIVMRDGKAVGVYRDSEGLIFIAPMKMRPNPAQKKLVVGPDGEVNMVELT